MFFLVPFLIRCNERNELLGMNGTAQRERKKQGKEEQEGKGGEGVYRTSKKGD